MSVADGADKVTAKKQDLSVKFDQFVSKLDAWLAGRRQNELYIMALLIPIALFAIDYQYVEPYVKKLHTASKAAYDDTMKKIQEFTSGGGKEQRERLKADADRLRAGIYRMNQTDFYLQAKLTDIDHLFFSKIEWAQHLDFITDEAAKRHVTIQAQENTVEAEKEGFNPVMSVNIDGYGQFASSLQYLFTVEASEKITPIEELHMTIDDKDRLKFEAKSTLWGMK